MNTLTDQQIEELAREMRIAIWGEQDKREWDKVKAGYIVNCRDFLSAIRRLGYRVERV